MKIVDLHCDTISCLSENNESLLKNTIQFDLERACESSLMLQFFAMFTMPAEPNIALRQILKQLEKYHTEIQINSSRVFPVCQYGDLLKSDNAGKLGALLHLEGGECLGNDLEILHMLYRMGLRSMGFTWNNRNQLADGIGEGNAGGGLSMKGREVAAEMDGLGIILDLSHMSINSFYDALNYYQKPVMATHSNAFKLCRHRRNLNDDQLKALRDHGGVVGITQVEDFVSETDASIEKMIDHIVYIAELIGAEHVALGSDFDGADDMVIKEVSGYNAMPELLSKRGFSAKETEMILSSNALGVLEQVLK